MANQRIAWIERNTHETRITLRLNLDGTGTSQIDTGIPFLDHMLDLFTRHGLFDLEVKAQGDLAVDYHHTVEDVGLVLGQAVREAVDDKRGIQRYGFFLLPMDETLARVAVDLSGRAFLAYRVEARDTMIRDFPLGLVREFFQAFTNQAQANVHAALEYGEEPHHIAEALFKGLGRSLRMAVSMDPRQAGVIPSTKGSL